MLMEPMGETKWFQQGRDALFDNTASYAVDPRSLAMRIMEIRTQLALEFIQDLKYVADDNKSLQMEVLQATLELGTTQHPIVTAPIGQSTVVWPQTQASQPTNDVARGRAARAAEEEARHKTRVPKNKKPPPPAASTAPPNWRMRVEVEQQVHGPAGAGDSAIPDSAVQGTRDMPSAAAAGQPGAAAAAAAQPPAAASDPPPPPASSAAVARAQPPAAAAAAPALHPELAELLPMIRSNPKGLTPEVAQMLSSAAFLTNGKLHPEIVAALGAAVAAGAVLHPEVKELLGGALGQVSVAEKPTTIIKDISEEQPLHSDEE